MLIERIKILKAKSGISFKDMANEMGIPYSSFKKYLCGSRKISEKNKVIITNYLNSKESK